jgi:hypothetical protein
MLLRREPTKNSEDLAATEFSQKTQLVIDMIWIGKWGFGGGQPCKTPMKAGRMIVKFEAEVVWSSFDHNILYRFRFLVFG